MGVLDRGFERALELQPGEAIRWSGPATHRVRHTWVGGRIYLTDQRFCFCPGVMSRGRYEIVRLPLASITGVELLGRDSAITRGGLRRRLRVRTSDGEEHSFSMPGFRRRAVEIQELLARDGD